VTQAFTPPGEKLGELCTGERLSGLKEFITETALCKPVGNSWSAACEAGWVVITTREKPDQNESTAGELYGWVREDVGGSIYSRMVTIHTAVCVLRDVFAVAAEIDARAIMRFI